jgi:hypothetical protein
VSGGANRVFWETESPEGEQCTLLTWSAMVHTWSLLPWYDTSFLICAKEPETLGSALCIKSAEQEDGS